MVVVILKMKWLKATCFFVTCVFVLERNPTIVVEIAEPIFAPITIHSAISTEMIPALSAVRVMMVAHVLVCMIVVMIVPIRTNHHIER